ncbi:hypothetical protein EDB85DRAFT_1887811 [Lactarius pseudohatsudake]|nr:hypothetical protein EDB85DRAFT_1892404 [Lactarius pseudohatsudake]KAH9038768.1 hypothetical protein EDB85DRAFT_1887811 [Lactarius pseudohatsudake]
MPSPPSPSFHDPDGDMLHAFPLHVQTSTQNSLSDSDVEPVLQTLGHPHVAAQSVNSTSQYQDNPLVHKTYRPLTRQHAIFFDPGPQCVGSGVRAKFDVKGILIGLDAKYPELGFLQYEGNLQGLNMYYLETASMLGARFYASNRVGMTEEAAGLFNQRVYIEYNIALWAHERAKMRERAHRIGGLIVGDSTATVGPHAPL